MQPQAGGTAVPDPLRVTDAREAITRAHRQEWARVVAALTRRFGDLDVAETITFEFQQKNHTATASSFNTPCRALASTSTSGQIGFDSGLCVA